MSRTVITKHLCDVCLDAGTERDAVFSEIVRVGPNSTRLDLCEQHRDDFIGMLPEVILRFQGNSEAYPGAPTSHRQHKNQMCQETGCPRPGPYSAAGLRSHIRARHVLSHR